MAVVTFDTLKVAEKLKSAGFTAEQAKAQAETLAEVMGAEAEKLVTKQDLENTRLGLVAAISDAKSDLVRWVVGVGILQMALIAGLVLKLIH